ncbi:hypothetical protein SELMODRAFT_441405 [Selaginella moellendorffii]|uniref:Uncharacterized protein n=1 Tax=Selaginella moellendorffii TaxID=88036 RepID=D8RJA0_SELML|nr:hypothetical protein SELMODRAFT_441405 [Selaginella moellendorffii]
MSETSSAIFKTSRSTPSSPSCCSRDQDDNPPALLLAAVLLLSPLLLLLFLVTQSVRPSPGGVPALPRLGLRHPASTAIARMLQRTPSSHPRRRLRLHHFQARPLEPARLIASVRPKPPDDPQLASHRQNPLPVWHPVLPFHVPLQEIPIAKEH